MRRNAVVAPLIALALSTFGALSLLSAGAGEAAETTVLVIESVAESQGTPNRTHFERAVTEVATEYDMNVVVERTDDGTLQARFDSGYPLSGLTKACVSLSPNDEVVLACLHDEQEVRVAHLTARVVADSSGR